MKLLPPLLLSLLTTVATASDRSPFFSQVNVLTSKNFDAVLKNSEDTGEKREGRGRKEVLTTQGNKKQLTSRPLPSSH